MVDDPAKSILPTPQTIHKVKEMIAQVVDEGGDIVWGPDLKVTELDSNNVRLVAGASIEPGQPCQVINGKVYPA